MEFDKMHTAFSRSLRPLVPCTILLGVFGGVVTAQQLPSSQDIALEILRQARITLADSHVSGVKDTATAKDNIMQTSRGEAAQRSQYKTAPGGTIKLSQRMLWGLSRIADTFTVHVSELAGADHSVNSRHYAGLAFDIDQINGKQVSASDPTFKTLKQLCQTLGANQVLGPGDADHDHHVHCAWPRT